MHHLGPIQIPNLQLVLDQCSAGETKGEQSCIEAAEKLIECAGAFDGTEPTPARVAWLVLFTRCWEPLQATLVMGRRTPPQYVEVSRRLQFELILDIALIQGTKALWKYLDTHLESGRDPDKVNDFLCAYLAYCIIQDIDFYNAMRQSNHLSSLYNKAFAEHAHQSRGILEMLRKLWGPTLSVSTPAEAEKGKREQRFYSHAAVNHLMDLLDSDSDLSRWADCVRENRQNGMYTFPELVDPELNSIRRVISHVLGPTLQWEYQRTSVALHGNSMESFLVSNDVAVIPYWTYPDDAEFGEASAGLAQLFHMNMVLLSVLAQAVNK